MTKSSHSGQGARAGVECALLASMGFTGSPDVFGKGGFFEALIGGENQPELLIKDFGAPYRMVSRSEEHTSELQSLMRISYAVFCLKKKIQTQQEQIIAT